MTLRLKINLIVAALTLGFIVAMSWMQLRSMRESVLEEVGAANRVAAQVLNRTVWRYTSRGTQEILNFLQGMGRLRSNDITLIDLAGRELYRSPPSAYKAGRDAPEWFDRLISPVSAVQTIEFTDGKLMVQANASRAVLDAWDSLKLLAAFGLLLLVVVNALVFWLVGRIVHPFGQIVAALTSCRAGAWMSSCPGWLVARPPLSVRPSTAWWTSCKTTSKPNDALGEPRCNCRTAGS